MLRQSSLIAIPILVLAANIVNPACATQATSNQHPKSKDHQKPKVDRCLEAEQVIRLRQSIASDEKTLAEAKKKLAAPEGKVAASDSEFHKAEEAFKEVDGKLKALEEQIDKLKKAGQAKEVEKAEKALGPLREQWQISCDRFGNAIEAWKQLREQVRTLPNKISEDKRALNRLLGIEVGAEHPKKKDKEEPTVEPITPPERKQEKKTESTTPQPATDKKPPEEDVTAAKDQVSKTEIALKGAKEKEQNIEKRITALQGQIELERKKRETERQKSDVAFEEIRNVTAELAKKEKVNTTARGLAFWCSLTPTISL